MQHVINMPWDKELRMYTLDCRSINYNLSIKVLRLKILVALIVNAGLIRRIIALLIFAYRNWFQRVFLLSKWFKTITWHAGQYNFIFPCHRRILHHITPFGKQREFYSMHRMSIWCNQMINSNWIVLNAFYIRKLT